MRDAKQDAFNKVLIAAAAIASAILSPPVDAQVNQPANGSANRPANNQGANAGDMFQQMFENFAAQAGPMAPMFGKLTPEQIAKIDRVQVSFAEESKFGQQVLDAYLQQLKQTQTAVTQQGDDVQYLLQLVQTIRPRMRNAGRYKELDLHLIESDSTDAYSIPGGHLLVTKGLLDSAVSEAAVVGVLAHELSHLDRGHQLIPLKQSKLANQPLNFEDRMLWVSMIARPNRPEQESEADEDATRWMMACGYDPKELARLLSSWDQRQDQVAPWMQMVPGFVKSHPDAGKRAQEVLRIATKHRSQYKLATYIGVKNLRTRTPRSVREFPN